MAELRIRVGAYMDRSFDSVLRTMEAATTRAQRKMVAEEARTQQKIAAEHTKAQQKIEAVTRKTTKDADAQLREMLKSLAGIEPKLSPGVKALADFGKEAQRNFKSAMLGFNELGRSIESGFGKMRTFNREMEKRSRIHPLFREHDFSDGAKAVGRGIQRGSRIAGRAAGAALNVGRDFANAIGVDTDLSSIIGKQVALETAAVQLSTSSYMPGQTGANSRRVDPRALIRQAREVGTRTGMTDTAIIGGLQEFVGLSGDLDTGRKLIEDLAVLSRASGTAFEDMAAAAGNLVQQLDGVDDKAGAVVGIMRAVAGQGKLGAVEIKDLASQMAKLAASAGRFEGSVQDNIVLMGAFAQSARQRGGAASATQAATSVQGLVQTLVTPARVARFKEQGIDVFNKSGLIRNPEEIVMDALRKQGMNPEGFKRMFANVTGGRAVEGFATIYRQAGGGEAGEQAVRAEFKRLKEAAMAQGEVADSFRQSMQTTGAKVAILNNQFGELGSKISSAVMPAFETLATGFARSMNALMDLGPDWVSALVGADGMEATKFSSIAMNSGIDMNTALHKAMARNEASPNLIKNADAVINDLDEQIKDTQNRLESAQGVFRKSMAFVTGTEEGREATENLLTEQLKRLNEQRQELASGRDWARQLLDEKVIKVQVIGGNAAPSAPPQLPRSTTVGPGR